MNEKKPILAKCVILVVDKHTNGLLEFQYGSDVKRQPSKETLKKLREIAEKALNEVWKKSTIKNLELMITLTYRS